MRRQSSLKKKRQSQHRISDLVKSPQWQRLRRSLLGQWNNRPEWCCFQLRAYLGNFRNKKKLRIVHNYLTGTGFRSGRIRHKCIDMLLTKIRNARISGSN